MEIPNSLNPKPLYHQKHRAMQPSVPFGLPAGPCAEEAVQTGSYACYLEVQG